MSHSCRMDASCHIPSYPLTCRIWSRALTKWHWHRHLLILFVTLVSSSSLSYPLRHPRILFVTLLSSSSPPYSRSMLIRHVTFQSLISRTRDCEPRTLHPYPDLFLRDKSHFEAGYQSRTLGHETCKRTRRFKRGWSKVRDQLENNYAQLSYLLPRLVCQSCHTYECVTPDLWVMSHISYIWMQKWVRRDVWVMSHV